MVRKCFKISLETKYFEMYRTMIGKYYSTPFVNKMLFTLCSMLKAWQCNYCQLLHDARVTQICPWASCQIRKLWVAPGMPGTFPPLVSDSDMHHGTCVMHVPWCMQRLLTGGFLWGWWPGKRSRHPRRRPNPKFYVSGKTPMPKIWQCNYCQLSAHGRYSSEKTKPSITWKSTGYRLPDISRKYIYFHWSQGDAVGKLN